ncbi:ATP-grasp domain-containing protein [Halorussus litoreus]|uniref:ATP-grasp domain-containing protein n=1 Tax=Halorussus litoreus TaxID=1710536 RepID=UPI000E221A45|nr:ATP-grasp domain-containing protein [Halorussus litoreus]
MATVLVTGVGSTGGTGTIGALQDHSDHEVVGVDMDPTATGFHLVDRGRVVPPASDDSWPVEMAAVVDEFDADAVVPLVDEELARLSELDERLPDEVGLVAPRQSVVDDTLDKYRMARRLADAGLSVPTTRLASEVVEGGSEDFDSDDLAPDDFPVVVKPRRGRGSRGVAKLDSLAALEAHLAETDRVAEDLVVQEYVSGTEYTTSVVATRDDRLLSIVPKEAIAKEGCTVRGATRLEPSVIASCKRIFSALSPGGPINVQQLRDDETGEVYTIEINPRFSSTACLTVEAGVNELDLLVRDALGERVEAPEGFEADLHLVRYTDELYASESELRTPAPKQPNNPDWA